MHFVVAKQKIQVKRLGFFHLCRRRNIIDDHESVRERLRIEEYEKATESERNFRGVF
jgi:hypothetical protein